MPTPPERGPAAFVAEFIGTFALVFFVTMVVVLFVAQPTANQPQPFIDWSVIGLVHVLVLFMLVQTLAVVSGAHFNPAITLGMIVIRQIRLIDGVIYWLCQLAGGVCGALVTKALLLDEGRGTHYGAVAISDRLGATAPAMVAEAIGTFFLVWAVVGVAVNPTAVKGWAGLAIGGTLGLGVMVMGPLTGAGLNPARAFGPAIVGHSFDGGGKWLLVYVLAPAVGAAVSAAGYFFMFILPGKKGVEGLEPVG